MGSYIAYLLPFHASIIEWRPNKLWKSRRQVFLTDVELIQWESSDREDFRFVNILNDE